METSPNAYRRPVQFASQAQLFSWLAESKAHDLRLVRSLTLRLADVDLTPLIATTSRRQGKDISAWDLYQQELIRLDEALATLPSLEYLDIFPLDKHKSMFVKSMYICFLARIPHHCAKLRRLTLHDNNDILQKVPDLKKLANVVFEGPVSASNPSRSTSKAELTLKPESEDVIVKIEADSKG